MDARLETIRKALNDIHSRLDQLTRDKTCDIQSIRDDLETVDGQYREARFQFEKDEKGHVIIPPGQAVLAELLESAHDRVHHLQM